MSQTATDIIIVSDVHLGSPVGRSKELLDFLKRITFKILILNGDIFDNLDARRLRQQDLDFLSYLRAAQHVPRAPKIVWIVGDHEKNAHTASVLTGFEVLEEYIFTYRGKRCLAIHGSQFDRLMKDTLLMRILGTTASWIYLKIQVIDIKKQRVSRWIKRTSKWFLRVSQGVAHGAIVYARSKNVEYVFCGHTHWDYAVEDRGIYYWNCGCWTDIPSTYLTLDEHGVGVHHVN